MQADPTRRGALGALARGASLSEVSRAAGVARSTLRALRVSCDRTLPGIYGDVTHQVRSVHPAGRVWHVRGPGVVVVQSNWKHWPCLFPQHGPGRRHERPIRLEDWLPEVVEAFPADFLRGLFHSDGCRVANWVTRVLWAGSGSATTTRGGSFRASGRARES